MLRRALSDALATCTSDGLVTVAAACETEPGDPGSPRRIVGGGFTFGMCAGYCLTEVTIDDATVTLTRQAWADITGEDLPEQIVVGELSEVGRQALADLEVEVATATLQTTYGCPDCADGGSGWVAVRDRGTDRRSTFEYGDPPPELAAIDEFLLGVIETLRECGTDEVVTTGPECVPADDPR